MSYSEENNPNKQQTPSKQSTGLNYRARLTIGLTLFLIIALAAVAYFNITRSRALTDFIRAVVFQEVEQQAENLLSKTVNDSATDANLFFETVADDVSIVTNYVASLLAQEQVLGSGDYWNAQENLTQLPENQWGNSADDPGSVLAPSSFELTDKSASEINTAILLDLVAPQTLSTNPNLKALYYVNTDGVLTYYPNIDLANTLGDYDARTRPYYLAVTPDINPAKEDFWTVPYFDEANKGLVETNSQPVYDEAGNFRGAVAANVDISTITEQVSNIAVGETGYAFLIDPGGRFISLPRTALADFGLDELALPEGGIPRSTVFDTETDIRAFASKMIAGETGLGTFTRNEKDLYLAYAPIEATGYSLGVVVPKEEMIQLYLTVSDSVVKEEATSQQFLILIILAVLLAGIAVSFLIGRVLTRPLEQLTYAAQEVSKGNFDVPIDTTQGGEIGTLAVAFDEMTTQIQDLVTNLELRVSERTRVLEASMDVSRSVSTILDQKQLVAEVVQQVRDSFNYYHVHIYLVDENTNDLVMAGGTGEAGQVLLGGGHKIAQGKGLVGRAAATKSTVLITNVEEEESWIPNPVLPDTKAEIATPIISGGRVLGVLDVQQNEVNSLTEIDTQLLELVATQIAIALRNARLYASAQSQARREAVANSIGQKLQTAANIESVLQIAAQELGKALNSQRATVQLSTPEAGDNGHQDALIA